MTNFFVTLIRSPSGKTAGNKTMIMLLLVNGDNSRCHYLPITHNNRLLNRRQATTAAYGVGDLYVHFIEVARYSLKNTVCYVT